MKQQGRRPMFVPLLSQSTGGHINTLIFFYTKRPGTLGNLEDLTISHFLSLSLSLSLYLSLSLSLSLTLILLHTIIQNQSHTQQCIQNERNQHITQRDRVRLIDQARAICSSIILTLQVLHGYKMIQGFELSLCSSSCSLLLGLLIPEPVPLHLESGVLIACDGLEPSPLCHSTTPSCWQLYCSFKGFSPKSTHFPVVLL